MVVGGIAILATITIINTTWRTESFRFENFKTADELIFFIKVNYPIGSGSEPLMNLLKSAGAKCRIISEEYYSKEDRAIGTVFLYQCSYNVGWFYDPPLIEYNVTLQLDDHKKIVGFSVGRYYGGL